jgi:two-component system, chemotaxis family, CheB/CheR fusion protein
VAASRPARNRKQKGGKQTSTAAAAHPSSSDAKPLACPIVGVGASAGGLEAFSEVLKEVPGDAGIALVLVQHLDPKHASILTELLARSTAMPVLQVTDGMPIQADHVYVIPPNTNMRISGGVLHLEVRPPTGQHMPIDFFFRSLAQDQGSKAIGVVLSGTASDGTLGLKAIKAEGGITFAQDVESARYDGMPRSAIAAGCVDFVLSPEGIARELIALCRHPYVNGATGAAPAEPADEAAFKEIFNMLRSATGVDFSYYKPGTIRRRTQRRMALHKIDRTEGYVEFLKENRGELQSLFQDILINVTGFFREPATFEAIMSRVLPVLFKDRPAEDSLRVWVPGCSSGEEVYSIAICLLEFMRETDTEVPLQIFGTDLSEVALERARAGIYADTIAADVSTERLRRFFVPVNGSYQITRSVRDACIFARQNVTKDPPFSKLDLILCRNVLIYLGPVLQMNVFRMFHYALQPKGFLVLGNSETIGHADDLFSAADKQVKVYTRKENPGRLLTPDLGPYHEIRHAQPGAGQTAQGGTAAEFQRRLDHLILARYSPPAIVVDSNMRVLQFRGQTAPYLEHSPGEATLDLSRMTPSAFGGEIRKLIRNAEARNTAVKSSGYTTVSLKDRVYHVRLSVTPLSATTGQPHFLVVFEERLPSAGKDGAKAREPREKAGSSRAKDLQQELATTKEYLQTVIEEQEAASEELKSAHEEVQSANEELQSTNEELLTAKEELQSTNEELTTVNEEMQSRNTELQQINNDVLNLLSSVTIPIIMLGNDLRIRRFTPQAEKILNLLPTDLGRPISDFKLKISVPDLVALCQDVIDNLASRQREVQDVEGRIYSMWIRPYRTVENRIDGVVLSMFDITERKQSAEARYRRLFEAAIDGIVIADARSGEILDANPFITRLFGYSRGSLAGVRFWESALFAGTAIDESILERLHEAESIQTWASLPAESGEQIEAEIISNLYEEGETKVIQFNIRDVSARKRQEDQLHRETAQRQQAQKMEAVGRLAGGVAHDFNNLLMAILGYCDLLQQDLTDRDKAASMLAQIRGAGERAAMLTKQLLAFGRKQVLHPTVLDLNQVAGEMQQLIQVMLRQDIELVLNLSPSLGRVRADRGQMEQVILNLVLNARDAMPNGGRITVATADVEVDRAFSEQHPAVPAGEYAALTVRDNGTGMDQETQSHLFEPFYTTKAKGKGAGLGLSTTYSIVRESGGYIWAYSEMGVGTTFTVYLPRVSGEVTPGDGAGTALKGAQGTETVLVVEDEPAVRAVARTFLEQRGYRVLEAPSAREGLRLARQHRGRIHLLLTDVVMPQMSGRELAFQLAPQRPDMKVLYMSGHPEDAIIDHGVLEDRIAFLQKPFTQGALAVKVRELLDRKE